MECRSLGMRLSTGEKRQRSFVNRFGQCFFRGVCMSNMLISGAGQFGVALSEKILKGFGHGDNCAYTGKFYSEAGIGLICRLFVPAFAFM